MALTHSKLESQWAPSRSIWTNASPDLSSPTSRVSLSLLKNPPPSKPSDAQDKPYPVGSSFVASPWGKRQPQISTNATPGKGSFDGSASALTCSGSGELPGGNKEHRGLQFSLADERLYNATTTNGHRWDASIKSYFASTKPTGKLSTANQVAGFDLPAASSSSTFTSWEPRCSSRDRRDMFNEVPIKEQPGSRQLNTSNVMPSRPGLAFGGFMPDCNDLDSHAAQASLRSPPMPQLRPRIMNGQDAHFDSFWEHKPNETRSRDLAKQSEHANHKGQSFSSMAHTFRPQSDAIGRDGRFVPFSEEWTSGGSLEEYSFDHCKKALPCKAADAPFRSSRPRDLSYSNGLAQGARVACSAAVGGQSITNRPHVSQVEMQSQMGTTSASFNGANMSLADRNRQHYLLSQPHETMPSAIQPPRGPSYSYGALQKRQLPNEMPICFPFPHGHQVIPPRVSHIPDYMPALSFRSALLEEFKTSGKGARRFELRDIYDHVVEFCGDQNGSRFIQDKLVTANSDEKSRVFGEILPNALQLMTDVFGNYVIQRFFERGDQNQKRILVGKMKGQMLALSTHVYGCRAVQSALHYVLVDQQVALVKELEPDNNVLKCVKDQNGNHVIQAAIEHVPSEHMPFIMDAFLGRVQQLAAHAYGCRVVQRLLKFWSEPGRSMVLGEVHACTPSLISDQYGNYVIQYMLENESYEDRLKIINVVRQDLIGYSKQKFASNVVERCFSCGTEEQRREMMLQLSARDERGESPLTYMIKDAYGNYVLQTLLDTLEDVNYATFVNILNPEIARARRFVPNKQAENVAKKMHRLDKKFGCDHMYSNPMMNAPSGRPTAIPMPISTAIPSPPLTADGHRTPISASLSSSTEGRHSGVSNPSRSFAPPHLGAGIPAS